MSHDGSKTIALSYATRGGLYIRSLSQSWLTDIFWTGQTLTLIFEVTSENTGTLTVYCRRRGLPNAFISLSWTKYSANTKILSEVYQFASEATVNRWIALAEETIAAESRADIPPL